MAKGKRLAKGKAADTAVRSGFPRFYKIYFTCLIIAIILIAVACFVIHSLLGEYEETRPKHVAEDVFNTYFAQIDYDKLLNDATYDAGLADKVAVEEYLRSEIGERELSWSIGSGTEKDEARYVVRAGNKQIGSIVLKTGENKSKHGFSLYELSRVELDLDPANIPGGAVTISVPTGYTVTVDGQMLDRSLIYETWINDNVLPYVPDGYDIGLEYETYAVRDITEVPQQITVTDSQGTVAQLEEDGLRYTALITGDKALEEAWSETVVNAVEGYAAYMQAVPGSSFTKIQQYFDPDSELYNSVKEAGKDLWMLYKPSGKDIQDEYVGEFHALDDHTFSCHISFVQILHRDNKEDYPNPVNMYVFLHDTGNGYQIFDWYNA